MRFARVRADSAAILSANPLHVDDGSVVCDGCSLRNSVDRAHAWVGWTSYRSGSGDPTCLCPSCSRRAFGRFMMFLLRPGGTLKSLWDFVPFLPLFFGAGLWSWYVAGPVADRLAGVVYILAFVALLLLFLVPAAIVTQHVVAFAYLLYVRRRVLRWREA